MMDGVVGSAERNFDEVAGKLLSLAQAVPSEHWGWRPAEEVRSVGEAYLHVATSNFRLASLLGGEVPDAIAERLGSFEEIESKTEAVALLERSIALVKSTLAALDGNDLLTEHDVFGRTMTGHDVVLALLSHCHEHLGQQIAYARSVGVAPPWSGGGEG